VEQAVSTTDIFFALFGLAMIANAIALVRHWRMMRVMQIVLNNLIETQVTFNELMENEQRKRL
jgi:hypothetical protein